MSQGAPSPETRRGLLAWRPAFWDFNPDDHPYAPLTDFRSLWFRMVLFMAVACLGPVLAVLAVDYNISRSALLDEEHGKLDRIAAAAGITVAHYLDERMAALRFAASDLDLPLRDPGEDAAALRAALDGLRLGYGGVAGLAVLDEKGVTAARTRGAVTPATKTTGSGSPRVSPVFAGPEGKSFLLVTTPLEEGAPRPLFLRATLEATGLERLMVSLRHAAVEAELFLVDLDNRLQVPAGAQGNVLDPAPLRVDESEYAVAGPHDTRAHDLGGVPHLAAAARISGSPFVVVAAEPLSRAMTEWQKKRIPFYWLAGGALVVVLALILATATYMVNKVFDADQNRMGALECMEPNSHLAAIGRLAAGVAHEVNNPLAIIQVKAGLIQDYLEMDTKYQGDTTLAKPLGDILDSVRRAGSITRQLLDFARSADLDAAPVCLHDVVEEILAFYQKEAGYRGVILRVDVPADLPKITTDRNKLMQVLINLVSNALQAMQDGDSLDIAATLQEDGMIGLTVRDTGSGMNSETLLHLFDPFYSTRKDQGGTGLGLAITRGLVREMGGEIDVESELGKGTEFTVTLPVIHHTAAAENGES